MEPVIDLLDDPYLRNCRLHRVVDGDTVDLIVDMGWNMSRKVRFRLTGVNTPEMNSSDPDERLAAWEAKQFVAETLSGWEMQSERTPDLEEWPLWVYSTKTGKYGRWLGHIGPRDSWLNRNSRLILNDMLVEEGHAMPYMV